MERKQQALVYGGGAVIAAGAIVAAVLTFSSGDAPSGPCDPAARPLPNEGLSEADGVGGCPAGMVPVETKKPYCVDQYEASLELVGDGGKTTSWSPYVNPGRERVRAVSLADSVPQSAISQVEATRACKAADKHLCTDAEWLRACQGSEGTTYPYGKTLEPGVCNDHRAQHPAIQYYGASDSSIWSKLDNPCINQQADSLARTGANSGCVSQAGAFDMMGNLHEWTANPSGVFRGGYYADTVKNGPGCRYATSAHAVGYQDYSTGFRCCAGKLE